MHTTERHTSLGKVPNERGQYPGFIPHHSIVIFDMVTRTEDGKVTEVVTQNVKYREI